MNETKNILEEPLFRKIPSENYTVSTNKFLKEKNRNADLRHRSMALFDSQIIDQSGESILH